MPVRKQDLFGGDLCGAYQSTGCVGSPYSQGMAQSQFPGWFRLCRVHLRVVYTLRYDFGYLAVGWILLAFDDFVDCSDCPCYLPLWTEVQTTDGTNRGHGDNDDHHQWQLNWVQKGKEKWDEQSVYIAMVFKIKRNAGCLVIRAEQAGIMQVTTQNRRRHS